METKRVLVTGGAGFIGSHLVERLVGLGYTVRVLDNLSTGSLKNLSNVIDSIELIRGDVSNESDVVKALEEMEVVVHLAALTDVVESFENPDAYLRVNVLGTYNVAKNSKRAAVLVFASSCAVYGEPIYVPIDERHPLNPPSPYAASKAAGEAFVWAFATPNGYRPVILRLFNVYGPRASAKGPYSGVVTAFLRNVVQGMPPVIFGDGRQTRDFVYVDDAVEAFILAIQKENAKGTYNVGSGKAVSIIELATMVLRVVGKEEMRPVYAPPRPGDVMESHANISRAERELGYRPKVALEEGLRKMLEEAFHGYGK